MNHQMVRLYRAAQELRNITTQAGVARALDASSQAVHNWEIRGMSQKAMLAAQRVFGCSASWLESGDGSMLLASNPESAATGNRIPLISYAQAGTWNETTSTPERVDAYLTAKGVSPKAFALEIVGDSMLPEFRPGDQVIIDPAVAPHPGSFVVAKNATDEVTFKKYRSRGVNAGGVLVFELVPLNDDHPTIRSDVTPTQILGTMIELRKNFRHR